MEPTPTPTTTAGELWQQSTQLAQQATSGHIGVNGAFLVGVLVFLLTLAAGVLAIRQGFAAGGGNTEKARKQSTVMAYSVGWGGFASILGISLVLGVVGFLVTSTISG